MKSGFLLFWIENSLISGWERDSAEIDEDRSVYVLIEYILTPKTDLAKKVEEGNMAVGFSLFAAGIAVGLVAAGSLTY